MPQHDILKAKVNIDDTNCSLSIKRSRVLTEKANRFVKQDLPRVNAHWLLSNHCSQASSMLTPRATSLFFPPHPQHFITLSLWEWLHNFRTLQSNFLIIETLNNKHYLHPIKMGVRTRSGRIRSFSNMKQMLRWSTTGRLKYQTKSAEFHISAAGKDLRWPTFTFQTFLHTHRHTHQKSISAHATTVRENFEAGI